MSEFKYVPVEPTEEMLDRAVAFALNVGLHSGYGWSAYMRDVWGRMLSATPAATVKQSLTYESDKEAVRNAALEEIEKIIDLASEEVTDNYDQYDDNDINKFWGVRDLESRIEHHINLLKSQPAQGEQ